MRFLRILTNALLAGGLGAAYLTVLVLQLNPHVPLVSSTAALWLGALGLFYGFPIAIFFFVLMLARDFFSLNALSPGWASVRVLAWLAAGLAGAASVLMWLNVGGLEPALADAAARRMKVGAAAASLSAVVLFGIAIAHYSFGRRGSRVGAALFAIAAVGSLALPLAARGPATQEWPAPSPRTPGVPPPAASDPRVMLLLLDGASLEYIWSRAAEGRLPHFARLLEAGATLDLATVRPTGPGPVWASVATGKYPSKHGVRSGRSYYVAGERRRIDLLPDHCAAHALVRFGLVSQERSTSAAWRARPLWNILSDAGIAVGLVRWPLTHPAPPVLGFVMSDRFHAQSDATLESGEAVFPADALPVARAAFAGGVAGAQTALVSAARTARLGGALEIPAGERDRRYQSAMSELRSWSPVRLAAIRYEVLDAAGHLYMGETTRGGVSDLPEEERRRHVQALDRNYAFVDTEVGAAMDALAPGDLLLVVSGFGMQRQHPVKRLAARLLGDPEMTGAHDRAPDGFLLAYGTPVEPGRPPRGSILDVAPTILYFLGLPISRDMDGYARPDLFTRAFTAERPITFIPTYER